jgi:hypothetical protein
MFENRLFAAFICSMIVAIAPCAAHADTSAATPSPALSASEKSFVDSVSRDLQTRFGTTAAATKGGYFRYTDEDETGAISWVNTSNWKSDQQHPSQLWYDVNGRLIGADFTVLKADSATAPELWGISPTRWITHGLHVHYGLKGANGMTYSGYGAKSAASVGASLTNPAPADIVKLGKAKSVDEVVFAFTFPAVWDLQMWVVPNPLGPFADSNPNVKPSKAATKEM